MNSFTFFPTFLHAGTYLAIGKSQNNEFQRKSFNLHKGHNLLKPMIITATDGYIIDVVGPFLSDSYHNDANIMKYILLANINDFLNWYDINDVIVVDRGFRDSRKTMEQLGLNVAMPDFLNGKKQVSVGFYTTPPSYFHPKLDLC